MEKAHRLGWDSCSTMSMGSSVTMFADRAPYLTTWRGGVGGRTGGGKAGEGNTKGGGTLIGTTWDQVGPGGTRWDNGHEQSKGRVDEQPPPPPARDASTQPTSAIQSVPTNGEGLLRTRHAHSTGR